MDKIPLTFTYQAKKYSGILSKVSGGGNTSRWHLMINNYYQGQLFRTDAGWQFANQKGLFNDLADEFGLWVEAFEKHRNL